MKICKYNSIRIVSGTRRILNSIDAIVICDTPKPSMLELNPRIARMMKDDSIVRIEIDHHLGGDSDYIGMPEYSLVTAASSSSERLLAVARPRLAVISCGARNRFGHPGTGALARLRAQGSVVWRTDRGGMVVVRWRPGGPLALWRPLPGRRAAP